MTFAMGIDGGGTHTRSLVINDLGAVIGMGNSGPSKPDAVDPETARANLHQAIWASCEPCGGPAMLDTIFVGMGGVVSEVDSEVVRRMLDGLALRPTIPIGIDHDIRVALAGGTAGQPGIALIAGTGSSCYGRNAAGESWRCGGWGYILDDVGSSFYLGQQALMAIVRSYDGRGPATALQGPVLEALGLHDPDEIMHRIYHPRLDHGGIAGLAPIVCAMADSDSVARSIITRGCADLAEMVLVTVHKLRLPEDTLVVPVGSLATASMIFRRTLEQAIHSVLPEAQVRAPLIPPVAGAAFLALQQTGITLTAAVLAKLGDVDPA
jgi:N-acetylglucosamine kinase-like BadF-type ATPase